MRFKLFILFLLVECGIKAQPEPVIGATEARDTVNAILSRDVAIGGDLTYEFIHFYAHKEDTAVTPDCPGTDLYTKILPNWRTGWGLDENDGLTFGGDSITIITPGDYYMVYSFTMVGNNAVDWKIALFKNNTKIYGVRRTTTGATNYSGGTLPFYFIDLVAGDDISIRVANLTAPGTVDPTFTNLNWFIYKIPE